MYFEIWIPAYAGMTNKRGQDARATIHVRATMSEMIKWNWYRLSIKDIEKREDYC